MKSSHALPLPAPEAFRPAPSVLRRVHGLRRQKGKIAAIEPQSGDYFLADNTMAALQLARQRHPDAVFYIVRVGHRTAHVHHSPNRRIGR
ncbi:MAG TPA: hypothetical protein VMW17_06840 [Candidatus Binatia bacterium]|nr:hypothetical protein [Candidatus Binatia bacterium]